MTGVLVGVGSVVSVATPPETSWGPQWVAIQPAPTPQTLQGLLSAGSRVGGMPSVGMWGVGVNVHQPPGSLHAPPRVG